MTQSGPDGHHPALGECTDAGCFCRTTTVIPTDALYQWEHYRLMCLDAQAAGVAWPAPPPYPDPNPTACKTDPDDTDMTSEQFHEQMAIGIPVDIVTIKINPMVDEALGIAVKHLSGVLEFDVHDVIAVADWVLTGTCDVAMKMAQQSMDNYRHIRDADAND